MRLTPIVLAPLVLAALAGAGCRKEPEAPPQTGTANPAATTPVEAPPSAADTADMATPPSPGP